jgi:hypothetical protein
MLTEVSGPTTFTTKIFDSGSPILPVGSMYSLPVPNFPPGGPNPYFTPDMSFSVTSTPLTLVTANMLPASVTYTLNVTVTDVSGALGSITLDFGRQIYAFPTVPLPPVYVASEVLTGTFTDMGGGPPHQNEVRSTLDVALTPLPVLVAVDRAPFPNPFIVVGPPTLVPPPSTINNTVIFEFLVAPMAGDSITIPIQLTVTAIPEPSTLTLLGLGSLGLIGYGWRLRKQVA